MDASGRPVKSATLDSRNQQLREAEDIFGIGVHDMLLDEEEQKEEAEKQKKPMKLEVCSIFYFEVLLVKISFLLYSRNTMNQVKSRKNISQQMMKELKLQIYPNVYK